ncbi:MAG: SDR family NAD(P)-dependent oxidoreductase [Actinobacteria bacterium]|nr:SDR family NAD(P)-dependent oxidoreductase [Actinomycetota bacterium]MCA1721294.1 SDR family NAD(P)-dependent oxidoreductase [Actinomycetota bacterium]
MSAWEARQLAEQTGRTFVITGSNSGVGLEAARDLVGRGGHLVLAVRDLAAGEKARAEIVRGARGSAEVRRLDLADLDSVATFAKELTEQLAAEDRQLNALVCNAGVMGGPLLFTSQEFERQMGTNHLGHAALVTALWPALHEAGGRVVVISSIAARGGRLSTATTREDLVRPAVYDTQKVYANTKQANLLFAQELHRRVVAAGSPVSVVAAHPGVSWTNLFPRQLREQGKAWLVPPLRLVHPLVFQSATAGALPTLRALDSSTPSGAFVGPKLLGGWRGRPELLEVFSTGSDPAVAARLCELTEDVLGTPLPV